jgi:undecaprenyl-diphosphatase
VDWSIFHALNDATRGNDPAQDAAEIFNSWAIFVLAAGAVVAWLFARPGGLLRPKLVTASAGVSAALAFVVNAVLGKLWYHDRPFVSHPKQTLLLVHHVADNSFPSDHASAAFAIAFAVFAFYRGIGLVFLIGAVGIALDRIFLGVHYPSDVGASALVGAGSALVVTQFGRPYLEWAVRQVSRLTDPVVAAATRQIAAARRSPRQ